MQLRIHQLELPADARSPPQVRKGRLERSRLPVEPIRRPGTQTRERDQRIRQGEVRRRVLHVQQDQCERRQRSSALQVPQVETWRHSRRFHQVELLEIPYRPKWCAI